MSKEAIELTMLVVGVSIIIILSYFLFTSNAKPKAELLTEEHQYERLGEVSKDVLYTRLPSIDKTMAQMIEDRIIQDNEMVYYGQGYGGINVTKVVYDYFNNYFDKNWKFTVKLTIKNGYVLWIPNSESHDESSISKVSPFEANEIGRFYTAPSGVYGNPSRVSVDSRGNVWVGNRGVRTLIKVGLWENKQCVDKNGNGVIETSRDYNGDGQITPDEMLDFGKDECMLAEVFLGTSKGNYDSNNNGGGVRAVCVDGNDNVYAGLMNDKKLFYISKEGNILKSWDIPVTPYGCFVDRDGIVWISGAGTQKLLKYNPVTNNFQTIDIGLFVYGIAPCFKDDCLVINTWENKHLVKLNTKTNGIIFNQEKSELDKGRGLCVDENENIYAVSTANKLLVKYDRNGNKIKDVATCKDPTGAGIDNFGKVWVTCLDAHIVGYDMDLNPRKGNEFGTAHYVYNFFTSFNAKMDETIRTVSFGYDIGSGDRVRTYHIPMPVPGEIGLFGEGILYTK